MVSLPPIQTKSAIILILVTLYLVFMISCSDALEKEDKQYWYKHALKDIQKSQAKRRIETRAKNVIIFIGDGMGVITHTLARIYKGQKEGKSGEEQELAWEQFPFSGLIKTYNTDHQVPDSAGTATAILSGVKTSMGVLGVDSTVPFDTCDKEQLREGSIPCIKDWAVKKGAKVGIVTTARVTHATPGAMYAHTPHRDWESDSDVPVQHKGCVKDIASQLVDSLLDKDIEFAMGGGAKKFILKDQGGSREDKDLTEELIKRGIKVFRNTAQLRNWDTESQMLGLFGNSHMDFEADRSIDGSGQPSLEEMTRQALNRLTKHEDGYVLLVEAGRIDHAHHLNQARHAMEETMQLEKAVKVATDMTSIEDTLILVTADHSHAVTMSGYPKRGNDILGYVYDYIDDRDKHRFMVTRGNQTQPYQTVSYANGPGYELHFDKETNDWKNISQFDVRAWNYTQPATFYLPYETHGGEDVAVYARGPMAHHVTGLHEQNYLGILMAYATCSNPEQFQCPANGGMSSFISRNQTYNNLLIMFIIFTCFTYYIE
eukprot:TRINITY_DN3484_c0_g1_i2.p1 TRINITY_DN3484_c0_g1~~TRINITY_DN3484_c0_g1_i2.p1  ORF type:complete len:555 (-),score=49.68 TRINITY_DN3484_c0_g1_i2:22-1653(-)